MSDSEDGTTAIDFAEASEWKKLKALIRQEPESLQEIDDFGMMPLHWACTDSGVPRSLIAELIEINPDATSVANKGGLLPLHIAVKAQLELATIKLLFGVYPDSISAKTSSGEMASELGRNVGIDDEIVEYLERFAEKVDRKYGQSSVRQRAHNLHIAVHGTRELIKILRRASGADVIGRDALSAAAGVHAARLADTLPEATHCELEYTVSHVSQPGFRSGTPSPRSELLG